MDPAYVGLGANLGDAAKRVRWAEAELGVLADLEHEPVRRELASVAGC